MAGGGRHRSILFVMVALMIVGAAMIPLLSVQLQPERKTLEMSVSCSWGGASPEIMEKEVISKLEGVLARLGGVEEMNSTSRQGGGYINLTFKEGTKMDVMRFEAASQIRNLYPQLPEGVSYPSLRVSSGGGSGGEVTILDYTVNTSLSIQDAERHIADNIVPALSRIEGVNSVDYWGIRPYHYEVTVDPDEAKAAGVTMNGISSAFDDYFTETTIGNVIYDEIPEAAGSQAEDKGNVILLKARASDMEVDFPNIPVVNNKGRIVLLGELATVRYVQERPNSYSRINGLDIIHISVGGLRGVNIVRLSSEIKAKMAELEKSFPQGFAVEINRDAADYINKELRNIFLRTLMTVAILLLFVLAVSRNGAYLLIIFATLLANVLIALIFYYLLDLQIHIYSLAGVTVSLGIIIDTSIIMVDHYSYYRDRKAFLAILGAVLTTIASLTVVFLLPPAQQLMFGDFAWVIIVNLAVSLGVSLLFIPALLEQFPLRRPMTAATTRMKKFVRGYNRRYSAVIGWGRRHRWVFIVVLILGFGVPLHKLPPQMKADWGEELTGWQKAYNKTLGGKFYQKNRGIFEKALGGSFRLFETSKPSRRRNNTEKERLTLTIRAGMVEGNTVHQLNDIVRHMENFLSSFDEIESYRTSVTTYDNSQITVTFKPEFENGIFPFTLYENVKREAIKFGGATWAIYGLPELNFNNNISSYSSFMQHRITLTGYNYNDLMRYAEGLRDSLLMNRRVSKAGIFGEVAWGADRRKQEFFVDIDREKAAMAGSTLNAYFGSLGQLLYSGEMSPVLVDGELRRVSLNSSQRESFDLWHVRNYPLRIDSMQVKLSDLGTISQEATGLDIYKNNQTYQLIVAFDYIGSSELSHRLIERHLERMNDRVLPIGYLAKTEGYSWWGAEEGKGKSFLLILLVIAIIYVVCAILFESLNKPLIIIMMIPVSFIGVFLTFGLFHFRFDQGGFASFILLSGLVVNAGIYVINEYNLISRKYPLRNHLEVYMKAYSRKIVPIILTIVSTVLGLIPFLVGKTDGFWRTFAIGTMGGMVFSVVAFLIYLPIFLPMKKK